MLSVLFLMVSLGGFIFLYGKINENKTIAETMMREWQAETTRRDEIRSLQRSIVEIEQEKALFETHFAESSNVVPFLDTIEKLATDAGAKSEVTSVDISKEKPELLVALTAKGDFEAIYAFIRLLENSPYEIEISSFNIEKPSILSDIKEQIVSREWRGAFTIRLLSFSK